MKPNQTDAVIDEIRKARQQISERFAHDPARIVAYYMEWQQQYRDRLIDTAEAPEAHGPIGRLTGMIGRSPNQN
jgi:hypothetical protein